MTVTVTTKQELKEAQESHIENIIVMGELADKIKKAQKITKLGKVGLAVLTTAIGIGVVTAPMTGGLSLLAAAPVAATTGLGTAAIISASAVGIALILAVYKGYDEISYENGKITFRRKSK